MTIELRENDVVRYDPPPKTGLLAGSDPRWCVEGMGVVRRRRDGALHVVDSYWGGGSEEKVYRFDQVDATVVFNLDDYDQLAHRERYRWERYAEADRAVITRQHGLERVLFVRKGATEDTDTIIANARDALHKAEAERDAAQRRVDYLREDLVRLVTKSEVRS